MSYRIKISLYIFVRCILGLALSSVNNEIQGNLENNHSTTDIYEDTQHCSTSLTSSSFGENAIDFYIIIDAIQQSRSNSSTVSHVLALVFTTKNDDDGDLDKKRCKWVKPATEDRGWMNVDKVLRRLQAAGKSVLLKRFVIDTKRNRTTTTASNNCGVDDVASQMDEFAFGSTTNMSGVDEVAMQHYEDVDVEQQQRLSEGINAKVENADCTRSKDMNGDPMR